MHYCPEDPCWEARKRRKPQIGDGMCATDDRKVTLIPILESLSVVHALPHAAG